MDKIAGMQGILAFAAFSIALLTFSILNREFSLWHDYVGHLGAKGATYSLWWNLIGFVLVGLLLFGFGVTYGIVLKDKLTGILLSLFGIGFALTAIPVDLEGSDSPVSKAHIVAICLALAFWLFGLSRISYKSSLDKRIRFRANIAAILLVSAILGYVIGLWTMPWTHRLVFGVVFGWTLMTATGLYLDYMTVNDLIEKRFKELE